MTPKSESISVVIAEDEPHARERLKKLLAVHEDIRVVAEFSSGNKLLSYLVEARPQVAFLDIEMPGLDAFEVLHSLADKDVHPPHLVFTTAYGTYAVQAFESEAVDYLLKPFDQERLSRSLNRLRKKISGKLSYSAGDATNALAMQMENAGRLIFKTGREYVFCKPESIECAHADGNYVCIFLPRRSVLVRTTMSEIDQKLSKHGFVRVHRSWIVNPEAVASLKYDRNSDAVLTLKSGREVEASRAYRENIQALLNEALD